MKEIEPRYFTNEEKRKEWEPEIYEKPEKCDHCGKEFEVMQHFDAIYESVCFDCYMKPSFKVYDEDEYEEAKAEKEVKNV